jgi:hypothetical protein
MKKKMSQVINFFFGKSTQSLLTPSSMELEIILGEAAGTRGNERKHGLSQ